jgi:hypothetical protein
MPLRAGKTIAKPVLEISRRNAAEALLRHDWVYRWKKIFSSMKSNSRLSAGDWVEVRSKEEILQTLNDRGELEALPFMPEMFQYCGKRFEVYKRAHKTCDPPNGMEGRRMPNAVHLKGLRCDGQAHGGCQASCLIFWKEAWLKKVGGPENTEPVVDANELSRSAGSKTRGKLCTEAAVLAGTRAPGVDSNCEDPVYVCQSTRVAFATQPLAWWDIRQYYEDISSGNERLSQVLSAFLFFLYYHLAESGIGLGGVLRWGYDQFQKLRGATPYPVRRGRVPKGLPTPTQRLDLKVGETVKVKDYQEILNTLDEAWKNRGLYFDKEMVPFCNKTFRVQQRVRQIINEKTGKMMRFKTEGIMLENVFCRSRYSQCRRFCPRGIPPYWREIWLERDAGSSHASVAKSPAEDSGKPEGKVGA